MDPRTVAHAMRHNPTPEERLLWRVLRRKALGARFRRQFPIGPFVADFCCPAVRLVVELDGAHHVASSSDASRDQWLRREGYVVARYWNREVRTNLDGVLADIRRRVAACSGGPPPAKRRP